MHKPRLSWSPWFEERLRSRGSHVRGDYTEDPHPIAHISGIQCYEWMREECAALDLARQQREDNVVSLVTTISATALLGIPGLLV